MPWLANSSTPKPSLFLTSVINLTSMYYQMWESLVKVKAFMFSLWFINCKLYDLINIVLLHDKIHFQKFSEILAKC